MKLAQYTNQERAIAAADSGSIRQRWMYGLRLLADQDKLAPAGGLRHGVTDALIAAAAKGGYKISAREIQRRLQCARTYPTEAQIRNAITDFKSWFELIQAGFPPYEIPEGESPADWRTQVEKDHDSARALADLIGEQGSLFPLSQFEPTEITLKHLEDYTEQQERITASFAETSRKRREYLGQLVTAVKGDMNATWAEAQTALDMAA
jgi:hypothetical protein